MTARLRQLFVLTVKELRQLVRDRTLFGFVIYIFTLHVIISSLGASDDVRRAPTAVLVLATLARSSGRSACSSSSRCCRC